MVKLNLDDIRRKHDEVKVRRGAFWAPKNGRNVVRVFPFYSPVTGKSELERKILQHFKTRTGKVALCQRTQAPNGESREGCPHCDYAAEVENRESKEKAKPFYGKTRAVLNVVPLLTGGKNESDLKMVACEASIQVFEHLVNLLVDVDDPNVYFGATGRDFRIIQDKDADPSRFYSCAFLDPSAERQQSQPLPTTLTEQVKDFFADESYNPEWWAKLHPSGTPQPQAAPTQPRPTPPPPAAPARPSGLPAGWVQHMTPEGKPYYQRPDGSVTWTLEEAPAPPRPRVGPKVRPPNPFVDADDPDVD